MDLESVLERWRGNYDDAGNKKGHQGKGKVVSKAVVVPGMGISEDAGNFVCGLLYFTVLAELERGRKKRKDAQPTHAKVVQAVFLHVPPLRTEEELDVGRRVVEALVKAIAEGVEI